MDEEKNPLKKKRNNAGFTLAETLMAMLIMLMVTAIVAAGIPVARNAYEGVVLASNSELLLSTTLSALRNELGTAKNIQVNGKEITYYNPSAMITSRIYLDDERKTDGILFQRYASVGLVDNHAEESIGVRLVTRAASNKNLYVTFGEVDPPTDDGVITFRNISVNTEDESRTGLATIGSYSIRVLSYE